MNALDPLTEEEKGMLHKRWHLLNAYQCMGDWESVQKLLEIFIEYRKEKMGEEK